MRFIALAMLLFFTISCGESVTKARDISQVIDAHFEYKDIQYTKGDIIRDGSLADGYIPYNFTGKIKNNSGINIREAHFWIDLYQDDEEVSIVYGGITIDSFANDETRDFGTRGYLSPNETFNRVTLEYDPP